MKNFLYSLFLVMVTISAYSQNNSNFDEKLAKELGADDYGMKTYIFCILKTGKNTTSSEVERQKLFEGHMQNINKLASEKKLVIAGPFMKNERNYRGIFILNCSTIEEAQELVNSDPAVKENLLDAELTPLYCSDALMKTNEIHNTISKIKL
jgi:uncharacterized protein